MTRREYWERRLGRRQEFGTRYVAQLIGYSQRTIQRKIAAGELRALGGKGHKLKHIRIDREVLIDFLVSQDTLEN